MPEKLNDYSFVIGVVTPVTDRAIAFHASLTPIYGVILLVELGAKVNALDRHRLYRRQQMLARFPSSSVDAMLSTPYRGVRRGSVECYGAGCGQS